MSIPRVGLGRSGNRPSGRVGSGSGIAFIQLCKGRQLFSKLQSHRFSQKIVVIGVLGHAESKSGLYFVL